MEEQQNHVSLYISEQIPQKTVLRSLSKETENCSKLLNLFSYKQSEDLSSAIISASNYYHGTSQSKFIEDVPVEAFEKTTFKVRQLRKALNKCKSGFVPISKDELYIKANTNASFTAASECQPVPLKLSQHESMIQGGEDEFQEKMRQVKVHQQYMRSRYAQNMKQNNKKSITFHKVDPKVAPKVAIYDYDGSLVSPLKSEACRLPVHYLELEVSLQEQRKQQKGVQKKVKQPIKPKNIVKFDQSANDPYYRPFNSSFLKDMSNIQWNQGVQLQSQKQEQRKILGYSSNQLNQKKKIDLFKNYQSPIKLKFQELQSYKNSIKRTTQPMIQRKSISKKNESSKTMLTKEQARLQSQASKTIQVANNAALEQLIRQEEQPESNHKMSNFAKKRTLHRKTSKSSKNFTKLVKTGISFSFKQESRALEKKKKTWKKPKGSNPYDF